jgi:hypothetical protein
MLMAYVYRSTHLVSGLVVLGVVVWELVFQRNAKRWQVWCLVPVAAVGLYINTARWVFDHDPLMQGANATWWWLAVYVFCPLILLPYVLFRTTEHIVGR